MTDDKKPPRAALLEIDAATRSTMARITGREHCACLSGNRLARKMHIEEQDPLAAGFRGAMHLVRSLAESASTVLDSRSIPWEEWVKVITLPREIENLTKVRTIQLYGSHLRRFPPEVGKMQALEELDIYTSYSLHWLPYELTRCANLKQSRMSTRALYGNRKTRMPFPKLHGPSASLLPSTCSVCDGGFDGPPELYWHTLLVGTDVVPLLIHSCSTRCIESVPDAPNGYRKRPHKGGPMSMHMDDAAEFTALFASAPRLFRRIPSQVTTTAEVWAAVASEPASVENIIAMEDLPEVVLRAGAMHANSRVRFMVARKPGLPADVLESLARDADMFVRRAVAGNPETTNPILKMLLKDPEETVRELVTKRQD